MKRSVFVVAIAAAFAYGGAANAATYIFAGDGGDIGETANLSGVIATAINTEQPPAPQLHQSDNGLGVDSTDRGDTGGGTGGDTGGDTGGGTGGGSGGPGPIRLRSLQSDNSDPDINQIDNIGDDEAIVFDFGSIVNFESITLKLASFFDDYEIYGTNNSGVTLCSSGGLSCLTSISTLIASGAGNGIEGLFGGDVTVDLAGAFRYLVATVPSGSGDGYRVYSIDASSVPLPAALPLMAMGLGLFGAGLKRKHARA